MVLLSLQRIGILLVSNFLLDYSRALSLVNPPTLNLESPTNASAANAPVRVPGGSPFSYTGNPNDNLFRINTLTMTPNPCTLRSECEISARGTFKSDLPSIQLELNISSDFDGHPEPIFIVNDNFCDWVNVQQRGVKSCPPKKGAAVLSFKMLLMQGWIPEATYGIDVKVVSGKSAALVSHIYTDLKLRDPLRTGAGAAPATS